MDAAIQKANDKMMFLANDKEILRQYNLREMAQIDYNSGLVKAKSEGRTEERIEIAKKLLGINLPLDQITIATGLTYKEIESLRDME